MVAILRYRLQETHEEFLKRLSATITGATLELSACLIPDELTGRRSTSPVTRVFVLAVNNIQAHPPKLQIVAQDTLTDDMVYISVMDETIDLIKVVSR